MCDKSGKWLTEQSRTANLRNLCRPCIVDCGISVNALRWSCTVTSPGASDRFGNTVNWHDWAVRNVRFGSRCRSKLPLAMGLLFIISVLSSGKLWKTLSSSSCPFRSILIILIHFERYPQNSWNGGQTVVIHLHFVYNFLLFANAKLLIYVSPLYLIYRISKRISCARLSASSRVIEFWSRYNFVTFGWIPLGTWVNLIPRNFNVNFSSDRLSWSMCATRTSNIGILQKKYNDVIMGAMAPQINSLIVVYSNVYSGADQRKHQSFASLAFVRGIHRWPVNSPQKGPVTRKMFPFDDVIMDVEVLVVLGGPCDIRYPSESREMSFVDNTNSIQLIWNFAQNTIILQNFLSERLHQSTSVCKLGYIWDIYKYSSPLVFVRYYYHCVMFDTTT